MKNCPLETELFHADGQTDVRTDRQKDRQRGGRADMTKLIVVFLNFVKRA